MNKAARDILGQILRARFDDRVIGTDFPSDPLGLFVNLSGNWGILPAQLHPGKRL